MWKLELYDYRYIYDRNSIRLERRGRRGQLDLQVLMQLVSITTNESRSRRGVLDNLFMLFYI